MPATWLSERYSISQRGLSLGPRRKIGKIGHGHVRRQIEALGDWGGASASSVTKPTNLLFVVLGLLTPRADCQINQFLNALIFAQDSGGTCLGKASANPFESDSIINNFGNYGSRF